jgi:hypothetical protein
MKTHREGRTATKAESAFNEMARGQSSKDVADDGVFDAVFPVVVYSQYLNDWGG